MDGKADDASEALKICTVALGKPMEGCFDTWEIHGKLNMMKYGYPTIPYDLMMI